MLVKDPQASSTYTPAWLTIGNITPGVTPAPLPIRTDAGAGFMFTLVGMISFALVMPASAVADRFGRKWAIVPAGYLECAGLGLVAASSAPRTLSSSSPCP